MFKEKKIKLVVKKTKCDHYKIGDAIYIDGPLIVKDKSDQICVTALSAIYPFIYAARKRVTKEQMGMEEMTFQCPDIGDVVEFSIEEWE